VDVRPDGEEGDSMFSEKPVFMLSQNDATFPKVAIAIYIIEMPFSWYVAYMAASAPLLLIVPK
jgi:hypothetical protein